MKLKLHFSNFQLNCSQLRKHWDETLVIPPHRDSLWNEVQIFQILWFSPIRTMKAINMSSEYSLQWQLLRYFSKWHKSSFWSTGIFLFILLRKDSHFAAWRSSCFCWSWWNKDRTSFAVFTSILVFSLHGHSNCFNFNYLLHYCLNIRLFLESLKSHP